MAKRDSATLVLSVRREGRQRALQQALLTPWRELADNAAAFTEWHIFVLWVRAITETADQIPTVVRHALQSRCPGFLESRTSQHEGNAPLWKSLEDWIIDQHFATARGEGWFDALIYYSYKDLRTEQAWTTWERTNADWRHDRPETWPTIEEWTTEVLATRCLAQPGTEKARAVRALGRVEASRLEQAVRESLESRSLALWIDSISVLPQSVNQLALAELSSRYPGLLSVDPELNLISPLFYRLVRYGDAKWRHAAHAEGWYSALRHLVVHHPRYHRLIHYNRHCHDEWSHVRPRPYPAFSEWLELADAYCIGGSS